MTEEKRKKLVVASTVGAVLLVVVLLVVMFFQLIPLSNKNKQLNELKAEIARYEALIENQADEIEIRKSKAWIEMRMRELGYVKISDVDLSK